MDAPIDRLRYIAVPRTTGRRLLSLGRLLVRDAPDNPSIEVGDTVEVLAKEVLRTADAYSLRIRESGPTIAVAEGELDDVVDVLLFGVNQRVEHFLVGELPGFRRLADQQTEGGFDYRGFIEQTKVARRVRGLLFAEGVGFTRLPYPDQAEHMRLLEQLITEEKLQGPLEELVGSRMMGALRECHGHYMEMVDQRAVRAQGSTINLRTVNANLQRALQNYLIALVAMIRDDDPENVASIRRALRPVDGLRELLYRERGRSRGRGGELIDPAGEGDGSSVDELIAEQTTVDAELGLPPEGESELDPELG